jgi:hypothetical protein
MPFMPGIARIARRPESARDAESPPCLVDQVAARWPEPAGTGCLAVRHDRAGLWPFRNRQGLRFRQLTTGDLPVIIGVTIAASVAVVSANVLVDFGYAMIDPRVRVQ